MEFRPQSWRLSQWLRPQGLVCPEHPRDVCLKGSWRIFPIPLVTGAWAVLRERLDFVCLGSSGAHGNSRQKCAGSSCAQRMLSHEAVCTLPSFHAWRIQHWAEQKCSLNDFSWRNVPAPHGAAPGSAQHSQNTALASLPSPPCWLSSFYCHLPHCVLLKMDLQTPPSTTTLKIKPLNQISWSLSEAELIFPTCKVWAHGDFSIFRSFCLADKTDLRRSPSKKHEVIQCLHLLQSNLPV